MTTIYVTSGRAIDIDGDFEEFVTELYDRESEGYTHIFVIDDEGREHGVRITSIEIIERRK